MQLNRKNSFFFIWKYKIDFCYNLKGWGCAYRTLQSMCSWISKVQSQNGIIANVGNQLIVADVPSIEEIQQTLVNINDKPPEFLNSTDWLGALEVFIETWNCQWKIFSRRRVINIFEILFSDFLCDWYTLWYIMSYSTYPKPQWNSPIFQYHKVLFWKFRWFDNDGRWSRYV